MERVNIEAKKDDSFETPVENTGAIKNSHEQAVKFVEGHKDALESYGKGSVKIEPAPPELATFAFNLEKNTIYVNDMFYKELGLPDEPTFFATLHEIEHFLEKKQILGEERGFVKFKKYLERLKKDRAFALTDNCVADIHVNRSVISKTNEEMSAVERKMYTEILFKEKDFTKAPRHIQFAQALLREARVSDEKCIVDPLVRAKLEKIGNIKGKSGLKLLEVMTAPETTMSERLTLQDRYIMPIIEELKKKDIEEEKTKRQKKKENEEEEKGEKPDKDSGNKPEEKKAEENKEEKSKDKGKGDKDKESEGEGGDGDENDDFDPNEFWKEEYKKAQKATPNAVSKEDVEKAVEEFEKAEKARKTSQKEMNEALDKEYAEKIGVTKEELQEYRKIVRELESIINPETNRNVIEELRELIARIIAKRKKRKVNPKYPTEEGEDLVDPSTLVSEVKKGNLSPKVWETVELKEKMDNKYGEIEITLVCDRSTSMAGEKQTEQQKSAVLMMEALKEFGDLCKSEQYNLIKPLEVGSEVYSFQSSGEDSKPVKEMSRELSEKDRIKTTSRLGSLEGSTTDFAPLEAIEKNLDEKSKKKIKDGELKKIVIVFTDGGSDDTQKVKTILNKLREEGIVVVGVGITESGASAIETYAPDARLAETAEKLPIVLGELLKEHLANI